MKADLWGATNATPSGEWEVFTPKPLAEVVCVCGHPFVGHHRTPGTECVESFKCGCTRYEERGSGDA